MHVFTRHNIYNANRLRWILRDELRDKSMNHGDKRKRQGDTAKSTSKQGGKPKLSRKAVKARAATRKKSSKSDEHKHQKRKEPIVAKKGAEPAMQGRVFEGFFDLPEELQQVVVVHALHIDPKALGRFCFGSKRTLALCRATRILLPGGTFDAKKKRYMLALQAARWAHSIGCSDPMQLRIARDLHPWLIALLDWLVQRGALLHVSKLAKVRILKRNGYTNRFNYGKHSYTFLKDIAPISFVRDIAKIDAKKLPVKELEALLLGSDAALGSTELAPTIKKLLEPWVKQWGRTEEHSKPLKKWHAGYGLVPVWGNSSASGFVHGLITFEVERILWLASINKSYDEIGDAFTDNIETLGSEAFGAKLQKFLEEDLGRYLPCKYSRSSLPPFFSLFSADLYVSGTYPRAGMLLGSFHRRVVPDH